MSMIFTVSQVFFSKCVVFLYSFDVQCLIDVALCKPLPHHQNRLRVIELYGVDSCVLSLFWFRVYGIGQYFSNKT